jgi:hypothetical protein
VGIVRKILLLVLLFIFSGIHVSAESNYIFDDNSDKKLKSAEEFFASNKLQYSTLDNSTLVIKKKLQYKNLERVIKDELNNNEYLLSNIHSIYTYQHPYVSPNRQVYLFCSIKNTNNTLEHRYYIIDGETAKPFDQGYGKSYKEK